MQRAPHPDPDLAALPAHRVLAGISLVVLAVFVGHMLTVPGVVVVLAGFVALVGLPIVVVAVVIRVGIVVSGYYPAREGTAASAQPARGPTTTAQQAEPAD